MKSARLEGPNFSGGKVRWGEVEVSRASYDAARELLSAAPLPQENLQEAFDVESQCQETPAVEPPADSSKDSKHAMRGKLRALARAKDRAECGTEEAWMSMGDVAVAASVHYETARRWVSKGKLPAARTKTGMIRIRRSDFIEFMGGAV
jgi:excisionase family DNA binding protein